MGVIDFFCFASSIRLRTSARLAKVGTGTDSIDSGLEIGIGLPVDTRASTQSVTEMSSIVSSRAADESFRKEANHRGAVRGTHTSAIRDCVGPLNLIHARCVIVTCMNTYDGFESTPAHLSKVVRGHSKDSMSKAIKKKGD